MALTQEPIEGVTGDTYTKVVANRASFEGVTLVAYIRPYGQTGEGQPYDVDVLDDGTLGVLTGSVPEGRYGIQVRCTDSNGVVETFPQNGYAWLVMAESLGPVPDVG